MTLELEVVGTDVKADASHPVKDKTNRYTLLNMNMDQILASKKGQGMMDPSSMMGMGGSDGFFEAMVGLPGMVLESKPRVTIEFK